MQNVLITGAASGIGSGLALELARAGKHVIVSDLRLGEATAVASAIGLAGGSAEAVAMDVASDASVAEAIASLSRPIDVLVNNAGLQHVAPLEEFTMPRWTLLIQVMLIGVARVTRAVLPGMRERGFGRLINIGSIHALVASPFKSAYVAAKHGLVGFSRTIALESTPISLPSSGRRQRTAPCSPSCRQRPAQPLPMNCASEPGMSLPTGIGGFRKRLRARRGEAIQAG